MPRPKGAVATEKVAYQCDKCGHKAVALRVKGTDAKYRCPKCKSTRVTFQAIGQEATEPGKPKASTEAIGVEHPRARPPAPPITTEPEAPPELVTDEAYWTHFHGMLMESMALVSGNKGWEFDDSTCEILGKHTYYIVEKYHIRIPWLMDIVMFLVILGGAYGKKIKENLIDKLRERAKKKAEQKAQEEKIPEHRVAGPLAEAPTIEEQIAAKLQ